MKVAGSAKPSLQASRSTTAPDDLFETEMSLEHAYFHSHPQLGRIAGQKINENFVQFRSLPYASISQRFARSTCLQSLPHQGTKTPTYFDATQYGPASIQSLDSFETDARWIQLPCKASSCSESQSEDCLGLTLTIPLGVLEDPGRRVPVAIFIHGGAFMVASGDREYYNPLAFCTDALEAGLPTIFASMNYRLNALGFLHSPDAADLLPANNGLYDQIHAFGWLRSFLPGFGGDVETMTAIGQSAGAASLSLHNSHPRSEPLYRRAISLSGSSVVLVTKTPGEHQAEFLHQAEKLGITTKGRSSRDVAQELINAPVDVIRRLDMPGPPCSGTELIPSRLWATMEHARHEIPNAWLESQVVSSCTFDGSISYMVALGQIRTRLAETFITICRGRMKDPSALLRIYDISSTDSDKEALEKICQIVTDIGFFNAAISHAKGAESHNPTYVQLFDMPNPFEGLLEPGRFATHTWDIVALLGAYDHLVPSGEMNGIKTWRRHIIEYIHDGTFPCRPWTSESLSTLEVSRSGCRCLGRDEVSQMRASKLMKLAEAEGGDAGADLLWDQVVRFFLKTGNPRYAHEAEALLRSVRD